MNALNYNDALAWLYSFIDTEYMGEFIHESEDLPRERVLLSHIGNPQLAYGVTHIAGTKGKGSTAAMVSAILSAAGVSTGLYTQPHLHTFRERVQVNQQMITEADTAQLVPRLQDALTHVNPALGPYITHEVITALAFLYFKEVAVEHAVVEVGLGGLLDATNVVEPMVTVITSISFDHMQALGSTLSEIAHAKAGILKTGVPTICSANEPEAVSTITHIANEQSSPLVRVGPINTADCAYTYKACRANSEYQWFEVYAPGKVYQDLKLLLLGEHQIENATTAIAVAEHLREMGLPINETAIRQGLLEAFHQGCLQVVGRKPWIIVDGAHNADSFAKLFTSLHRHFSFKRLILVLGMMADKDINGIAAEIRRAEVDRVITTEVVHPRVMRASDIATRIIASVPSKVKVLVRLDIRAALLEALHSAMPDDLVCVAGSFYVVGESLRWFTTQTGVMLNESQFSKLDH